MWATQFPEHQKDAPTFLVTQSSRPNHAITTGLANESRDATHSKIVHQTSASFNLPGGPNKTKTQRKMGEILKARMELDGLGVVSLVY